MPRVKHKTTMFVVLRDGWIPDGFFDSQQEAEAFVEAQRGKYLHSWTIRAVTEDYPQRFCNATFDAPPTMRKR